MKRIRMTKEQKIKFGIVGYGNLGKGVALAASQNPDMELLGIFTRRNPNTIAADFPVYHLSDLNQFKGELDIVILCGGSMSDLPEQVIEIAQNFHTVDSFDTHAKIPEYFEKVNKVNLANNTLSLISTGWDPGLFSMARLLGIAVLPEGEDYTFWGKGLSQGHSDALRKVKGVKNGVQYTIPKEEALSKVRAGEQPKLNAADRHVRICYVVAETNADTEAIENDIKTMPHYFADYNTEVHFIDEATLEVEHQSMPHGGIVIRTGRSGHNETQRLEFSLSLESNPNFTSSVLIAFARATAKLAKEGQIGTKTVFDIPLGYLLAESPEELRARLL